ncbi:MAG: ABC transporter permease [Planctomycetes bacterium]|nr:ABC transporter permease [Planctomycetota bacterium]
MNLPHTFSLLKRESRGARGRMLFFVACLALGVGAVTGVSALVASVRNSMASESRELLAADVKVTSRAPFPDWLDPAIEARQPVAVTKTIELATMIAAPSKVAGEPGSSRLVELKATGPEYPLYGSMLTWPEGLSIADLADDEILAASELCGALGLETGDVIKIGGQDFRLRGQLQSEPDRLDFGMTLGPRVFLTTAGLARTNLVEFGSRVKYGRLIQVSQEESAGDLKAWKRALGREADTTARLQVSTHREGQPGVERTLRNVERYLGLVALLSLLLGGVGVAQVVRVWIEERTQAVAIQRSLGLRPRDIMQLYLVQVALLACLASLIGCMVGIAMPILAATVAPDFVDPTSVLANPWPILLRGFGLGIVIAMLFAIGPLTAIYKVSPALVLRAQAAPLGIPKWVQAGVAALLLSGIFAAAAIQADSAMVGATFSMALLILVGLLVLGARFAMWIATHIPRNWAGLYLRHGLSSLARPGAGTTATIVALGLGVHVIASLLLVESRLSRELKDGVPAEAPSVFLVDVQPDQWQGVQERLHDHGASYVDSTPVCMARLASIDGRAVRDIAKEREGQEGRAKWVLTREQRLTWQDEMASSNKLIAGRWFQDDGVREVSLEQRFADDLGAQIGTRLTFDLQGLPVEFVVTSLREVDWVSFSINFFVVVEPGSLAGAPFAYLASARVNTEEEQSLQDVLVAGFPNVTLLRLGPMLEKVSGVIERVATGVRVLGWFAVLAGLAILAGAVAAGGLRRKREVALQKTLGMTRAGVALFLGVEYAAVGLVAGLCGTVAAYALAWGFLEQQLNLAHELNWLWFPVFGLGSAAIAALCGILSSLRALATKPAVSLR